MKVTFNYLMSDSKALQIGRLVSLTVINGNKQMQISTTIDPKKEFATVPHCSGRYGSQSIVVRRPVRTQLSP